jgi:hypothetical protein
MPGDPIARQELARLSSRPWGWVSTRSCHSPRGVAETVGNSAAVCSSASRGDTRSRTDGRGGTGLPETISASGISTGPASVVTTQDASPHAVHTPSTSVNAGPPVGPHSPGSSRRITTRWLRT